MQLIFNAPMSPNEAVKLLCIGDDTTDIVLLLVERFAVAIAVSVHHDAAFYADPLIPKGCNRIKDAHPPVCAASMTLLVFLIPAERLICLSLLLNASMQSLLIGFDAHQIIIVLLHNLVQRFFWVCNASSVTPTPVNSTALSTHRTTSCSLTNLCSIGITACTMPR